MRKFRERLALALAPWLKPTWAMRCRDVPRTITVEITGDASAMERAFKRGEDRAARR